MRLQATEIQKPYSSANLNSESMGKAKPTCGSGGHGFQVGKSAVYGIEVKGHRSVPGPSKWGPDSLRHRAVRRITRTQIEWLCWVKSPTRLSGAKLNITRLIRTSAVLLSTSEDPPPSGCGPKMGVLCLSYP
ncbi:hypothetical protein OROMI_017396 [Orobanche minor]